MGLLDSLAYSPDMAMGMGLLAAGGNSRMPVSVGQGLASGWGNMQDTLKQKQGAEEMAQMAKVREQQMQMNGAQIEESARRRQALAKFRDMLPPELQSQFDVDPQGFLSLLNKQQEEYTLTPGAARYRGTQKLAEVPMKPNEAPLPWYVRQGPQGQMQIDPAYAEFEKAKAREAKPATPYFTPVADATRGMGTFDNRTGRYVFDSVSPMVKPADSPELQGRIAGAKETATTKAGAEAKRDVNMSGVTDTITEARKLLQSKPTASAVGVGVDSALGVFGVSTKGADTASKLKAIGGHLVAKMPRMEGPQSNYDVQNYKEMAGDIGNPMLPVSRRLAALEAVEKIISKYDKSAKSNPVDSLLEKYK